MKKIIRLLTLALLTVPVTTFAQSEGNQNTSEPVGKVVASKPDSLLDWETYLYNPLWRYPPHGRLSGCYYGTAIH